MLLLGSFTSVSFKKKRREAARAFVYFFIHVYNSSSLTSAELQYINVGFLSGLFWWGIGYIIHKLNNVNVPESNSGRRHAVSQLTRAGIPLCTLLRLPRIPPSPGAYWLLYWRRGLICSFPVLLQGEQGLWGEGRSLLLCGNRLHVACRLSRGLAGCLRSTAPPQIILLKTKKYEQKRKI